MRKVVIGSLIAVLVVVIVAGAFAQGRQPGQGQGGRGQRGGMQMGSTMSAIVAEGKIFALKDSVIYKINATTMEVEKKKKLDLAQGDENMTRIMTRMRMSMHVEGKNLFLISYNAVFKINIDSLEHAGTLKADDLTAPEEKEESKEE